MVSSLSPRTAGWITLEASFTCSRLYFLSRKFAGVRTAPSKASCSKDLRFEVVATSGVPGAWVLRAGSSGRLQPRAAALTAPTVSGEFVVSSVATRPLSLAKCTPPPTFATRLVPAPGPAGAGAQVFAPALLGFVLRGLICFSGISSTPRGWKAEMRKLSLGVFII